MRTLRIAASLLPITVLGTVLLFRHTLGYGFNYDDYHFIRPHTLAEVRDSFWGPWDRTGIEVPFYRPVTVAFYALRFELFALNSEAHHAVSLGLFACVAALAGWLAYRLSGRLAAAWLGALFFVAHPAMPYSLVAWVTNQMHLIEALVVLSALSWWDAVRARRLVWWLPLLAFAAAAFLIKEDGVMLLPVIVAAHWLRRRLTEPELAPIPRGFLVSAAMLLAALVSVRAVALEGLGGYGRPRVATAWANFSKGLDRTLRLVPADRRWQPAASTFAVILPILAIVSWRRVSPGARLCMCTGVTTAVLFNLPSVFVWKAEQMHLVAFGSTLLLTGSATAVLDAMMSPALRLGAAVVFAGGLAAFAAVASDISRDFEPFGPIVLGHDDIVRGWSAVPHQLREFLAWKREPGAARRLSANPARHVDHVVFGVHGLETSSDGVRYQWMADTIAEIHVRATARAVTIPLRHAFEVFREPALVRVEVEGRRLDELRLDTSAWRYSSLALARNASAGSLRMTRIRVLIDRVWYPARIIPRSTDPRALGVQIGELTIR